MENDPQYHDNYFRAKKKVDEIKGFYGHLTSYILVNVFFLVINLLTSPEELWFYWPMLGWGIGVVVHGIKVFNYSPLLGRNWEQRKIREYMEQEKQNNEKYR